MRGSKGVGGKGAGGKGSGPPLRGLPNSTQPILPKYKYVPPQYPPHLGSLIPFKRGPMQVPPLRPTDHRRTPLGLCADEHGNAPVLEDGVSWGMWASSHDEAEIVELIGNDPLFLDAFKSKSKEDDNPKRPPQRSRLSLSEARASLRPPAHPSCVPLKPSVLPKGGTPHERLLRLIRELPPAEEMASSAHNLTVNRSLSTLLQWLRLTGNLCNFPCKRWLLAPRPAQLRLAASVGGPHCSLLQYCCLRGLDSPAHTAGLLQAAADLRVVLSVTSGLLWRVEQCLVELWRAFCAQCEQEGLEESSWPTRFEDTWNEAVTAAGSRHLGALKAVHAVFAHLDPSLMFSQRGWDVSTGFMREVFPLWPQGPDWSTVLNDPLNFSVTTHELSALHRTLELIQMALYELHIWSFEDGSVLGEDRPKRFRQSAGAVVLSLTAAGLLPDPLLRMVVASMWEPRLRIPASLQVFQPE